MVGRKIAAGEMPGVVTVVWRNGELAQLNALALHDPITKWVPEFANMRVLRRADGPIHETDPAPRVITIEDLMTHRPLG